MTTLVTGATGFLGSAVARALLARGEPVRLLVRPASDRRNLVGLDAELAVGDLDDAASLATALRGCRALYHVAADYRLWSPDPAALYRTNVDGTERLLRLAAEAGVGRIVYTSSVATLGRRSDGGPADETTPLSGAQLAQMAGPYKRSKFDAERRVEAMVRDDGIPAVIVNPATVIGPGDWRPTPTGRVIEDAVRGRIPAYVDTGLNLVHVDDVAAGHLLAYERGKVGERYILGGEDMTLREILSEIARLVGRKPPRLRLPRRLVLPVAYAAEAWARLRDAPGEPLITVEGLRSAKTRMYFSSARAENELGYRARPALAALAETVAWVRGRAG